MMALQSRETPRGGGGAGAGTHIYFCTVTCRWTGHHFQDSDSGTGYHFQDSDSGTGYHFFRIPTPGQGIISVKIGTITGSIFFIFDS